MIRGQVLIPLNSGLVGYPKGDGAYLQVTVLIPLNSGLVGYPATRRTSRPTRRLNPFEFRAGWLLGGAQQ